MSKSTDIRVKQVTWSTTQIDYRSPMKFGGRIVSDVTLLDVQIEAEDRLGKCATGRGSMPLGNVWGWPSQMLDNQQTLAMMQELGTAIAKAANDLAEFGDPLQLCTRLSHQYQTLADRVTTTANSSEPMPRLAQLVCGSPSEAALFDAWGRTAKLNSYNMLGSEFMNQELAAFLGQDFAGEYLDQYTRRQPVDHLPLYHLVGALDPLTASDLPSRLDDGLPETLGEWIVADGLTHLKIKLNGDDLPWDVDRVVRIDAVAAEVQANRNCSDWCYSLDFNEKCQNVGYVLEFLAKLQAKSPAGFDRVQYIEQPTSRDLRANPDNVMHEAAKIKPVVIDESLVDLESLLLARELGYSGVALKACKGHSEALLMGAAAQKYGMFLCVQDLTCPGYSFLHSSSLAARVNSVSAIEGNGRQYCPVGNKAWKQKYPSMFEITDGMVGTFCLDGVGLGFE